MEWFCKTSTTLSSAKAEFCERDNRTIMESVRSLLHTSGFPLSFWAEACHTVVYTLNHTGSRLIPRHTPFTLWYGFKPSLEHFRVFGCHVYAYIDKQYRTKLDPKSHLCYFLGYCDNTKGYRIWDPVTSKVLIRRDVTFSEQLLYGSPKESSHSSEQVPTATLSLQISPADDSSTTKHSSQPLNFSSSSPTSSSSCPSEHTLSPTIPVSSLSIPATSQDESSSPITPRTLRSHPNF